LLSKLPMPFTILPVLPFSTLIPKSADMLPKWAHDSVKNGQKIWLRGRALTDSLRLGRRWLIVLSLGYLNEIRRE
jgi:hypothetical protein